MQLHTLKARTKRIPTDRVGRGGRRGKTSGRGTKGQKARAGHRMRPEMRDMIKKIPKLRGHGKNRSRTVRIDRTIYTPVNLDVLEAQFAAKDTVTVALLAKKDIVSMVGGRLPRVKILGRGTLTKSLSVSVDRVSESAKKAIEAAGGSVLSNA